MRIANLKLLSLVIGGAAAGLMSSAITADARTEGALGAQTRDTTKAGCIAPWAQGIVGTCGGPTVLVTRDLPIDSTNVNFLTIAGFYGDTNTGCRALGISSDQSSIYATSFAYGTTDFSGNKIWQTKSIGSVYVPTGGNLNLECYVGNTDKLSNFSW